jgi:outer membrane protein, heavy metal efflux system
MPLVRSLVTIASGLQARRSLCCAGLAASVAALPLHGQERTHRDAMPALTLAQLLDSVRLGSPLVGAASARVRAARGSRTTAGAFGNPMLTYQVENVAFPGGSAPPMPREAMTMAMVPLEPLYQRSARVRRADAEVGAATAEAIVARRSVSLAAARAFYRTALAQVSHAAMVDLAAWLDSVVAYNRARVAEGVAAEADLIRSEVERDRTAAELAMHEADLARARAELSAFVSERVESRTLAVAIDDTPLPFPTGTDAAMAIRATDTGQSAPPDTIVTALADRSVAVRPDVLAAHRRLSAAQAGVTGERTMVVRQLGATIGTKATMGSTSMVAGFTLPIPLFDQNRGEVHRASAERDATALELRATERSARAEIVGAYEAARVLTARATTLAARAGGGYLARADESRRIALGAYREGAVPLVQVLDAARAWGDARTAYYATLFAQHEAILELLVALGRDPSPSSAARADDRTR